MLAAHGYKDLRRFSWGRETEVNVRGGLYDTALQEATAKVNQDIVAIPLKGRANANTQAGHFGTALQTAKIGR